MSDAPKVTVTNDRSEIDRMVAILRTGKWSGSGGSIFANDIADTIEALANSEFELTIESNTRAAAQADFTARILAALDMGEAE